MYYSIKNMDAPTPRMYGCEALEKREILIVGTATRIEWATTIDIDPAAPADFVGDGCCMPQFANGQFQVVILDFVTNFVPPKRVEAMIREAKRVGRRVMGRCHVGVGTLPGPKQRYPHSVAPSGVEWIEIRQAEVRHHA